MQIPRDLSRRMLEIVDQTPLVDVYERLMPESQRISQRYDLITWLLAYAGTEVQSLGLSAEDMALLADIGGDPEQRWQRFSTWWPYLRTTGVGRVVLRMAWDLFDVQEIDNRTWKDVSAHLWTSSESGFYQRILREQANIIVTLVDGSIDAHARSCCAPVYSCDRFLSVRNHADLEALTSEFDQPCTVIEQFDPLLEQAIQGAQSAGYVALRVDSLPDLTLPSREQVEWALGRTFRQEESLDGEQLAGAGVEPALQSYLLHRLLFFAGRVGIPLQVNIGSTVVAERLGYVSTRYPQVRFVGLYGGYGDSFSLLSLARRLPNLFLAMGALWVVAPRLARATLSDWIQGIPSSKLFVFSGNATMVEAVMVRAQIAREQIAAVFAEMVASGSLDEQDAALVIHRIMAGNAQAYFGHFT